MGRRSRYAVCGAKWLAVAGVTLAAASCGDIIGMDPANPARGPGQLVGNGDPVSDGNFRGGNDVHPDARGVRVPSEQGQIDCTSECRSYCDALGLDNPVNVGACPVTWGVGLTTQPVQRLEACRRLYADMIGRYPTGEEINTVCSLDSWGATVNELLASDEFVMVQQRKWADKLLYNNRAVNFERSFDMDDLVGKAYRGLVGWDQFAAVTAAHPVIMRRLDTPSDRAEFVFKLFLGRPPYEAERSDIARLYRLWNNGYWTHPHVDVVPDSFIEFACVDGDGERDMETIGECTSVNWGHNELTLRPDRKRLEQEGEQEGLLWTGFLKPNEWEALQLPGRLIASEPAFWEWAVDEALTQYLGYNFSVDAPEVRHELVQYLLAYNGDIRALHFAVATSFVYLQSSKGDTATGHPWTSGQLKQIEVEGWVDSIKRTTGVGLSQCDHRLPHPEDYIELDNNDDEQGDQSLSGWALALVRNSRWELEDDALEVVDDYRNLTRTLGGCPSNEVSGRFTTVSVLNTAVQESFVAEVCGIGDESGVAIERLLPPGMSASATVDGVAAEAILLHQQRLFLGRDPSAQELEEIQSLAAECSSGSCDAQAFARPMCFALVSSSEMLFY